MKNYTLLFLILFAFAGHAQTSPASDNTTDDKFILTPKPLAKPRLNNALVYGCRPGNDFLYRIPCQGERPIRFTAEGLPASLKLDENSGIIRGSAPARGTYHLVLTAKNKKGKAVKTFDIIAGDKIGLTPPMGWNTWYTYYDRISDKLMREAADLFVSTGMADVGYAYVDIDDCWAVVPNNKAKEPTRESNGAIKSNANFPDMKGLTDYIHSKGLKAGIYTSPGLKTCTGRTGAYGHEQQDAEQYAKWGFDFLKYDLCSYRSLITADKSIAAQQKPYRQMGDILKNIHRDIFYNMCQYGYGESWKWAASVGGNSWRTAGDLGIKELDKVYDIALRNASFRNYSRPGEWNDPDYISIGYFGDNINKSNPPKPSLMAPWLQYSYVSMWSLMASPLFYGGDLTHLDDFTLGILCNPEIIEINQDPLGQCAQVIMHGDKQFIMVKDLYDGSKAVGIFNREKKPVEMNATWEEMGVQGKQMIRDAWREKDLGTFTNEFKSIIPAQGCLVFKISKIQK